MVDTEWFINVCAVSGRIQKTKEMFLFIDYRHCRGEVHQRVGIAQEFKPARKSNTGQFTYYFLSVWDITWRDMSLLCCAMPCCTMLYPTLPCTDLLCPALPCPALPCPALELLCTPLLCCTALICTGLFRELQCCVLC